MTHTFDELKDKTVAQLREIAEGIDHEAVHGFSTMHKHQLLHAICEALNLEEHVHHDVVGIDKRAIKTKIRELKARRDAALEAHDPQALKEVRRKIHRLKRKIRAATV
jgi:hypothetical protein